MKLPKLRKVPATTIEKYSKRSTTITYYINDGKFEGVSFKVHSLSMKGKHFSFIYDVVRAPKTIEKDIINGLTKLYAQFQQVVKNIMYNVLVESVYAASEVVKPHEPIHNKLVVARKKNKKGRHK